MVISGVMATMATMPKASVRILPAHGLARAHGKGQQERGRHGAGGHAAGIEGDGCKDLGHKKAEAERKRIARHQEPQQMKRPSARVPSQSPRDTDMPMESPAIITFCEMAPPVISSTCLFSTSTAGSALTI